MFERLRDKMNITFDNILFFDDSVLNILDAKELNIKSICVNATKLITWQNVKDGIALFDKRKRRYSHD
jgi:FMN phosphatase YigB (HAD superfamily)